MRLVICSIIQFLLVSTAFAQTYRNPNTQEKIALNKVVKAIIPVLKPFADGNWTLEDGGADAPEDYSVAINPTEPISSAPFTDMRFTMNQETGLWNAEIKPLLDKIQDPKNTPANETSEAAYNNLTDEYEKMSEVIIEVHINEAKINVKPDQGNKNDLKIPGSYFSFKPVKDPITQQELKHQYVLVFGNWEGAKLDNRSGISFYDFAFKHPKGSPYIENIVIILKGNNKRIEEMLHKIDWYPVNKGLTL